MQCSKCCAFTEHYTKMIWSYCDIYNSYLHMFIATSSTYLPMFREQSTWYTTYLQTFLALDLHPQCSHLSYPTLADICISADNPWNYKNSNVKCKKRIYGVVCFLYVQGKTTLKDAMCMLKGLLTKFGYITKIKKNNWKLYTNNSYIKIEENRMQPRYFGSKLRVDTFKLQRKMWCHLTPAN